MNQYIRGLDGLRALAISWVMFGHVSASLAYEPASAIEKGMTLLANMGWVGVQLFFVISGFLITKILLDNKGSPQQLKNFYIRRSLRIFPIYYITLAFFFILLPLFNAAPTWIQEPIDHQWWFWTYMHNWIRPYMGDSGFGHLWSLAIEEQYYLLWPLFVIWLSPKRLIQICLLLVVSAPIFRYWFFYHYPEAWGGIETGASAAYDFTVSRWDAIALGSLLGIISKQPKLIEPLNRYCVFALSAVLAIIAIQIVIFHHFISVSAGVSLLNQTTAALAFFLVVIFVVDRQTSPLTKALEFAPIKLVGKYSYAMYLFHLPIMICWNNYWQFEAANYSGIKMAMLVLFNYGSVFLLTMILAAASWALIEHPFLKLKKRYS
ncbi:acyltransferase family protein [Aliikangiella sp. IMCC44653]